MKTLLTRLPDDVHRQLKITVATKGEPSIQKVLLRLITKYLKDNPLGKVN